MKKKLIIIDGHNAIGQIERLRHIQQTKGDKEARSSLLNMVQNFKSSQLNSEIEVVFDGTGETGNLVKYKDNIDCHYSAKQRDADDRIIYLAREGATSYTVIVISDDNYVINNCRQLRGAQIKHPSCLEIIKKISYIKGREETKKLQTDTKIEITKWYEGQLERNKKNN